MFPRQPMFTPLVMTACRRNRASPGTMSEECRPSPGGLPIVATGSVEVSEAKGGHRFGGWWAQKMSALASTALLLVQ